MAGLNQDVPQFECYVRKRFLIDKGSAIIPKVDNEELEKCIVFGISSVEGLAIGFHIMTVSGAVVYRLPIHALCARPHVPKRNLPELELWDCLSYNVSVHVFSYLKARKAIAHLFNGERVAGKYLFTIDWEGNNYADGVGDPGHKCAHVLELMEGNYAALPNNRIWPWFDPSFIEVPDQPPKYKTNTTIYKVENKGRWAATDEYLYSVEQDRTRSDTNKDPQT